MSSPTASSNLFQLPLDPVMQRILSLYPVPNGPPVDDVRGLLYFPSSSTTTGDNVTARIDHNFSSREIFTVRYTFNRFEDPNYAHTDFLPGLGGTGTKQRRQDASLRLTSLFTQELVNEVRFGANRINFPLICQGVSTFNSFGPTDAFGRGLDYTMPGIAGMGCLVLSDRNGSQRFSGTYTTGDSITRIAGQHTFKAGFEFRDVYSNSYDNFVSRSLVDFQNFSNYGVSAILPTGNPSVDQNATLQNMIWSLFGLEGSQTQAQFFNKAGNRTANDLRGFRQKEVAAFVQDTFKVLPNLTLNYGLRYQFNGVPSEVNNLLSTLYTNPSGPAPFTFAIAGDGDGKGLPPLYNNDWHDFEPRIGIAWDPFHRGDTSVRAGYGIFHDRLFGQLLGLTRGNPPFEQFFFAPFFSAPTAPTPTGCPFPQQIPTPFLCLGPPVSAGFLPPTLTSSPVVNNGAFILPFLIDPHLRMPYSQNWMLGLQQQLPGNVMMEINYVGSKGTRLLRVVDGNPPQPALVAQLEAQGIPQTALQFDNLYFLGAANNTAFLHTDSFTTVGSSIYNALQMNITKRLSHGLFIQAAYTWGHAIDNSSDPLVPTAGGETFPRNSFNLAAERGNSDFDVRQRLVLNYTWEIPLGSGHQHFGEGAMGKILEGWQVAGITTFASGLPFDVFTSVDSAHTGFAQRPDYNPSATLFPVVDPRTQTGPNLGLFSNPPFGAGGNLMRNKFFGPGINNWDTVLQKTTRISERMSVQFNQPGNLTSDFGTFGQSTGEVTRPDGTSGARQVQFGLKFQF